MTLKPILRPKRAAVGLAALAICAAGALAGLENTRAATQPVTMVGTDVSSYGFSPQSVTINVGDTVTWTNQSNTSHTATSNAGDPAAFDTGAVGTNRTFSVTFTVAGTYTYHCTIHPNMVGTIIVQQAGPTATQPAATATATLGIGPPPPPPPPPSRATATPTATTPPTPTATATAAPILTLSAKLSPKNVAPGKKVKLQVLTLAGAKLAMTISYKGTKTVTRHGTAKTGGVYKRTFTISSHAQRGTLTFKIKATFQGQSLTKSVKGKVT